MLLIDGYNVIAPVAAPGRGSPLHWLEIERRRLLDRLVEHLDEVVRTRTCVVFDAKDAPPNQASRFDYHGMDIRFATDYPEADDLIEELIATHPAPRSLTVVSSDHRLKAAARRRRAGAFSSDAWLDQLLDGHTQLIRYPKHKPQHPPASGGNNLGQHLIDGMDASPEAMPSDAELDEMIRRYQK